MEIKFGREQILFRKKKHYILEQNINVKIKEKTITHLEKGSDAGHAIKKQKAICSKKHTLPT